MKLERVLSIQNLNTAKRNAEWHTAIREIIER